MTLITIIILITFFHALIKLDKKIRINLLLFLIILLSAINEVLSFFLIKYDNKIILNSSIYISIHALIWLILLYKLFDEKKTILFLSIAFIVFSLLNLFLGQGLHSFNTYTFIIGSIIYVCLFVVEVIKKIKEENLLFFQMNIFILSFAPIFFFLFFSLMFAFNNKNILLYSIFDKLILYSLFGNIANIIYYGLINLYIFKEYRTK